MRLTKAQIDTIRKAASQHFGEGALVWLFGSRLDDSQRGGDVDLYVEATHRKCFKPTKPYTITAA